MEGRVGHSRYEDLIVETGLTYSKQKKMANVAGGWAVEEGKRN